MSPAFFQKSSSVAPVDAGHLHTTPPPAQEDGQNYSAAFIHSALDDYGLSSAQFRVYGHISRRAGSGVAFAAVASMARVCQLHPQTIRKALRFLVKHGLISRETRPGMTPFYRLTPMWQWCPPSKIGGNPSDSDTPPSISAATPAKEMQGRPCETNIAEGNPVQGNPKKENIHNNRASEIPCNEVEAVEQAKEAGVPPEFARVEYLRLDSVGWVNGVGNPVRKWLPHLRKRWTDEQNQQSRRASQNGARPGRSGGFVPPRKFDSSNYKQQIDTF